MKQEQRSLVAVVLSLAVFVLWYWLFAPTPPEPKTETGEKSAPIAETKSEQPATPSGGAEKGSSVSQQETTKPKGPKELSKISSPLLEATFVNHGAQLESLTLAGYYQDVGSDAPLIDLVGEQGRALALDCRYCNFKLPGEASYQKIASDEYGVTYRWRSKEVIVTRRYTVDPKRYLIDSEWTIENVSGRSLEGQIGLAWSTTNPPSKKKGFLSGLGGGDVNEKTVAYQLAGSIERLRREKSDREGLEQGVIAWTGLESRYFLSALVSRQLSEQEVLRYRFQGAELEAALYYPKVVIAPGDRTSAHLRGIAPMASAIGRRDSPHRS